MPKPPCPWRTNALALLAACLFLPGLAGCQTAKPPPASSVLPEPAATAPPSSSAPAPREPFRTGLDFAALQAGNADTIGWIEVPGTVIDYPVMRGVDNSLYLRTSAEGQPSKWGAIFIDMGNSEDFRDPVTVAYGHFTSEDTFFTQLHRYKDPAYFAQNREVFLYSPTSQNRYEVVAAFTTGDENILYRKDFSRPGALQDFITWMAEAPGANLALENTTSQDRFLVMSTCVQLVGGDQRYIVVARLAESR